MPSIGDIFGKGSIAEQMFVWGILNNVIGALIQPFLNEMSRAENSEFPTVQLPADAAAASLARGLDNPDHASSVAAQSGFGDEAFAMMAKLATSAPDLGAVIDLLRRGLIHPGSSNGDEVSARGALTDAGIRPEWQELILNLAVQLPTGAEVLDALLKGQISPAEAKDRWAKAGNDPTWFQDAFNANGEPPTPVQALEMLNRGIIPEGGTGSAAVSYEQAFLEGPWRNKWLTSFLALREYLPPPRTVTAMYHAQQLDHATAAALLVKQGVTPTLAEAYLKPPVHSTANTAKHLAKGDVLALYTDKLIDHAKALATLTGLGYTAVDAGLELDLADFKATAAAIRASVTRIRTLFRGGKLSETEARAELHALGLTATQATELIDTWAVTHAEVTRTFTPAQAVDLWYYSVVSAADAITILVGLGYDEFDAWSLLTIKDHGGDIGVPRPASPYPVPPRKPLK